MLIILQGSSFSQLSQQLMPQFQQDVVVYLLVKQLQEQMVWFLMAWVLYQFLLVRFLQQNLKFIFLSYLLSQKDSLPLILSVCLVSSFLSQCLATALRVHYCQLGIFAYDCYHLYFYLKCCVSKMDLSAQLMASWIEKLTFCCWQQIVLYLQSLHLTVTL